MSRYGKSGRRWIAAAVLVLVVGVVVYYCVRPSKRADEERAHPLSLSDVEGNSIRIPSQPSIQMHLISRTQPTPLSPVTTWNGTNGDNATTPVGH